MEHDIELIQKIALEVEAEYKLGGLSDGLYFDFASDVAKRYAERTIGDDIVQKGCIRLLYEIHEELMAKEKEGFETWQDLKINLENQNAILRVLRLVQER